jgi:hypothetical protein
MWPSANSICAGEFAMKFSRRLVIRGRRFLLRRKGAKVSPPSVRNNLRIPSPPARSGIDALEPARILAIAPHVFKILCVATRPQIRDAIIPRVAIDMIDEICRPVSMDIEPGEPMRLVDAAIDANSDVPVTINVAG